METGVWLLVFAAATFISILAGAGWKVFGAQLDALREAMDRVDKAATKTAETLRHEHELREREVKDQLAKMVGGAEFTQFEKRVIAMETQMNVVIATRPTTGELKAEASGLGARIDLLEIIMRNGRHGAS